MCVYTHYRIDYIVITPWGKQCTLQSESNSDGYPIRTFDEAESLAQKGLKSYASENYKVLSYSILSQTITYTEWKQCS